MTPGLSEIVRDVERGGPECLDFAWDHTESLYLIVVIDLDRTGAHRPTGLFVGFLDRVLAAIYGVGLPVGELGDLTSQIPHDLCDKLRA